LNSAITNLALIQIIFLNQQKVFLTSSFSPSHSILNMAQNQVQQILERAQKLVENENYAGARKAFSELHQILPHHPMPLLSRATCYLQENRWAAALPDALAVLELPDGPIEEEIAPNCSTYHAAACVRLAKAYNELKRHDDCKRMLARRATIEEEYAKKKESDNTSVKTDEERVQQLKALGNKHFQTGAFDQAILAYCEALGLDPNNHLLHANACQAMLRHGSHKEARFHAEQCTVLRPEWPKGHYRLGKCNEIQVK
jgi:tetratricopeptide (TPR) repeat protein